MPEKRIASVTAFARALGTPLARGTGASLALSVAGPAAEGTLLEAIVKAAAGVFEAAAASIALIDPTTGELVYQAAWGASAAEIVGVRLAPGTGLAGSVIARNEGEALPDVRNDPRFAAQIAAGTGYVPHTMLLAPLRRDGAALGALTVLDRRDGRAFGSRHLARAGLFADLAVAALR
jgi:signal transduction protein with GAF and PtsI domain